MAKLDEVSVGEEVAVTRPDAIVNQTTGLCVAHAGTQPKEGRPLLRRHQSTPQREDRPSAGAGGSHVVTLGHARVNGIRGGGWVKTAEDPLEGTSMAASIGRRVHGQTDPHAARPGGP
jgi:hypothetical protein